MCFPILYEWREQVEDGGLMSYGSSLAWITRRVAVYIDLIFKGAKPADLPVELPSQFQFVINLKTARSLGLTLPPATDHWPPTWARGTRCATPCPAAQRR